MAQQYPNIYIVAISREDREVVYKYFKQNPDLKDLNFGYEIVNAIQYLFEQMDIQANLYALYFDQEGKLVSHGDPLDEQGYQALQFLDLGGSKQALSKTDTQIVKIPKSELEMHLSQYTLANSATAYVPGKAVLLICFATWCPPCRDTVPFIIEY